MQVHFSGEEALTGSILQVITIFDFQRNGRRKIKLFYSLPTNYIYPATYNLSDNPDLL